MKRLLAILGLVLLGPTAASAQVLWIDGRHEPEPDLPERVRMTVDPAPQPRPALQYSLLPKYRDEQVGNAAPYYYRALLAHASLRGRMQSLPKEQRDLLDADFRVDDWTLEERRKFPREQARKLIDAHHNVLENLRIAAHREECDWNLRFRDLDGTDSITFILEEFQNVRSIARLLNLKVRLEIVEGRHEDAIETLQLGFQLGKDTANVPILINDLIGIAIGAIMRHELTELIATPGCPNLYWALADLGEPYIDIRKSMKQEALLAETLFPFLKDADTAEHSDEEWDRIVRESANSIREVAGLAAMGEAPELVHGALLIAKGYPRAIERLVESGYDRTEVEAMPVGRVIAIDAQRTFRFTRDEFFKWTLLPPRESWRRYREAEKQMKLDGLLGPNGNEVLPIASSLLPAVGAVGVAQLRTERDLRVVRVIEALRMYAAENGRFPKSLDDITTVPVPDDPWNDAPFPYRVQDGVAILDAPSPEGFPKRGFARVYELTLRKK